MHKNPARQLGDGVVNAAFPQPFHRFLATGILALVLFPPIVTAHICLLRHFSGLHKGQRRRAGAMAQLRLTGNGKTGLLEMFLSFQTFLVTKIRRIRKFNLGG
jgi:hypothetical protein